MNQRPNLNITNLRIDHESKRIERLQAELDKAKKALEKYGDKRLGKSYDDAYREWGGPDPRMTVGERPNEKYYTGRGTYIDIDTFSQKTSDQFKDSGSISSYIEGITFNIEFSKKELEELISIRDRHLESVRETGFDLDGLDSEGYDKEGFNIEGYDRKGYDKTGYDKAGFDREGYNKAGLDRQGFNREGIHSKTNTRYSPLGWDVDGYTEDGFRNYHGTKVDREGYDRDGYQIVDKEKFRL